MAPAGNSAGSGALRAAGDRGQSALTRLISSRFDAATACAPGEVARDGGVREPAPCGPAEIAPETGKCHPVGVPPNAPCPPGQLALEDGRYLPAGVTPEACAEGVTADGDRGQPPAPGPERRRQDDARPEPRHTRAPARLHRAVHKAVGRARGSSQAGVAAGPRATAAEIHSPIAVDSGVDAPRKPHEFGRAAGCALRHQRAGSTNAPTPSTRALDNNRRLPVRAIPESLCRGISRALYMDNRYVATGGPSSEARVGGPDVQRRYASAS